ncbi:IS110 family transposase [Sphingomonas sp. LM7]|uniref:IS110 family transposase n=1 Tax=Sphingomonas sp. LM7 TaxID=1938607 RepID=UPI00098406B5|nr:IS110 family transposase [Sphingomonas sp. LM7]AQR74199.1 IS110 family transposase [Sphingomonas sp. LM7]
MRAKHWVGLDVGESCTRVCVLRKRGPAVLECSTGSSAEDIARGLSMFEIADIDSIVMESGAPGEIERQLKKMGYPVVVLDVRKTHRYLSIRHNKTDENDARGLAEIARLGELSRLSVYSKSYDSEVLRNQLCVRKRLVDTRAEIQTSLRSLLRNHGSQLRRVPHGKAMRPAIEAEFARLQSTGASQIVSQLLPLVDVWETLSGHIKRIDDELACIARLNPVVQRFIQIPGVGPMCAISFYATIDDPHRFARTADVGAYLGMVPRVQQSGASLHRTRVTRAGDAMARGYLVLAAGVALTRAKQSSALREWGLDLRKKVGFSKARMAVARKLAVTMLSMWKADKDFVPYPQRA